MARHRDSQIRRELTSLISPRRIRAVARELGAVRRRRKVDVVALVYSLVLGFATGDRRTLAGLRRAYERVTGTCLAPSAFYDRFTPELASVMKRLLAEVMDRINEQRPRLHFALNSFRQVLVADGSVIRLHEALAPAFPSIWTNQMPASAKLHVVMNVVGRGPSSIQITHGSRHDLRLLRAGEWMRDKLLIFDLGYFQGHLFSRIGLYGGFFLSRLKKHTNPVIVASARPEHQRFVGSKLQDAVARMHGEPIDFDGTLHYQTHRSKWRHHTMPVRIVGVWNPAALRYHLYLTNVPREKLGLEHDPAVYAARWEIELLFRELKTQYRIDDLRSRSRHVTECLLYASLITLAVSRRLHRLLAPNPERLPQRHPLDRWAVLFTTISRDLLDLVIGPTSQRSFIAVRLRRFLLHEAPDPNRRRLLLPVRAQLGQFGALA